MSPAPGREANKPNPTLAPLERMIGTWTTVGTHPMVKDTVFHGRTTFEWLEDGAFLIIRSEIDEPEIPTGLAIIGSDDALGTFSMQYFDERGVSRKYEVSVEGDVVRWWRDSPDFSQRMTCTIAADGRTMSAKGEMSRDGRKSWEGDLELTYTRMA